MTQSLTHLNSQGQARMVDVSAKTVTRREAQAQAWVRYPDEAWEILSQNDFQTSKGAIADVARIGGIMGAKKTAELIPFCHTLPLERCKIQIEPDPATQRISILCSVATEAKTGVEMEALTGVSTAALTLYDMTKSLSHEIVIEEISLVSKTGGKSDFQRG
ncbi:cyclic pyranopterin monophosphate synthase MoaC [Puniceicoccus vermicola]|uniref:cyclic pyranopterin monophosphate synthase n=1 Tax=Puniceicoccus vermicola TaxID=388746 RepID=A0A7X1E5R9_9BACT|nr:cyclic pyranopterin monophosphate synthase MoaC [Puniceicoccus vermicola]MBC2603935.1 cyclic pyranopterin monophosphate synthase MoaC [Puniceicoccus vermicola]